MNQQTTSTTGNNGQGTAHDLFALTDEQILEIEPEEQREDRRDSSEASLPQNHNAEQGSMQAQAATRVESQATGHGAEPPAWVTEAMSDPQRGREARAFWEGSQKTKQEAAAYREVFAKPEEARAAAARARVLDEIDRAYFGATGNSAEQTSAARAQLAQSMLQENPAAFREMVFAGLRALEETGKQGSTEAGNVTAAPSGNSTAAHTGQQSSQDSSTAGRTNGDDARNTQLAAYAAFEKAANEELEKSVGGVIERTIERALPNIAKTDRASVIGAQHAAPLQARLQSAIRQDVEAALKGDRQLSEQIALIISGRRPGDAGTPTPRFDGDTRAQVVRLIDERAKQLVPGAAKRVLQDWTQTTLATHRTRTRQNDTAAARSDLAPANSDAKTPRLQAGDSSRPSASFDFAQGKRNDSRGGKGAKVDYRKLSDEQILEL